MRAGDLIRICMQNLCRHKVRTFLTVLGVVVGCCSVVIMISIGIGMKKAQETMLAQLGDLTVIQVYPAGKGRGSARLDKKAIRKLKKLKKAEAVTPKLTDDQALAVLYGGKDKRYKAEYISIVGIDLHAAEAMGYALKEGKWQPDKQDRIYAGENMAYLFADTKRPEGKNTVEMYGGDWDERGMPVMPPPFLDIMNTPLTLEMESGKEDGQKIVQAMKAGGRLKEDYGKGSETSMGMLMSLELYQSLLDQHARMTGKKRDSRVGYPEALVKVRDIGSVAETEREIKKMGFRTSSMESIRRPMEQEARQKQMMLGGLGAISLFVAAIGIANTMIMSISERTREIGVMKALGCFVGDVRRIFLLEAGCIGFIGGITGVGLSYLISVLMNLAAARSALNQGELAAAAAVPVKLSVIPWWLAVFALVFSVMIGVGAGCYPASRAVSVPALEAIRRD